MEIKEENNILCRLKNQRNWDVGHIQAPKRGYRHRNWDVGHGKELLRKGKTPRKSEAFGRVNDVSPT